MKQKSILMGLVAISSLIMTFALILINDVSALKSTGTPVLKYGSATDHIVYGDILC
ncbi:MAG: hypothetical protein HKP31_07840 [Nitrosopumilus sp.]|nr:hypothetical protein [Nitrosopumilus sp.]